MKKEKKKHKHKDENIKRMCYAFPEEMEEKAIPLIPEEFGILIAKKIVRYREADINKMAKPIHKEGLFNLLWSSFVTRIYPMDGCEYYYCIYSKHDIRNDLILCLDDLLWTI